MLGYSINHTSPAPISKKKGPWTAVQVTVSRRLTFWNRKLFSHGVGKVVSIEEQEIAGASLELYVVAFEKDKMTLRVPTNKAEEIGMRSLSSPDVVTQALTTLKGKPKVKRAMWSRRAQEYEQKINSGDLIAIAEVVRDLHRNDEQREQSYSERQLYEAALDRLTREVAAVDDGDEVAAARKVDSVLVSRAA